MSSNSSSASTSKVDQDLKIIIDAHDSLRRKHNLMASTTSDALTATTDLLIIQSKKIKKQDRRTTIAYVALVVQAIYLLIFL